MSGPQTEAGRRLFRANPADAVREPEEWELAEVSPAAVLAIEAEAAAAEREKFAALVEAARDVAEGRYIAVDGETLREGGAEGGVVAPYLVLAVMHRLAEEDLER